MMKHKGRVRLLVHALIALLGSGAAMAQSLSAQAQPTRNDVFVGESFQLQIAVSGSEHPEQPELRALDGFSVRYLGGQQNSSQSISIVNGKVNRNVSKGYVFAYELTPTRAGTLVIPSISVTADGTVTQTQPVSIAVRQAAQTDDFKLRISLPKTQCYVGEAVTLTVTWYLGQDVRSFGFNLPALDNAALFHADPHVDTSTGGPYYRIPLGGSEVIGEKGQGTLDGKPYATITFRKILIPKEPGPLELGPAVVSCEALAGYRDRGARSRGPFGDDFMSHFFNDDFFGSRREGVYRRVSVPSNRLRLDVLPLPMEGRPAGFAGHVGEYKIETAATPVDVSVGDPITLNIVLSGPRYLDQVTLPPLDRQTALARDFRIPSEMAAGKVTAAGKLFTQTIRALRPDVEQIPPIELPYFDVAAKEYRIARSAPIPLHVKAAKVLTAEDAEGRELTVVPGRSLEGWSAGIAYNYDDMSLLEDQRMGLEVWLHSPSRIVAVTVPPSVYLLAWLAVTVIRKRNADPLTARQRKAMRVFVRHLGGDSDAPGQAVLAGLRTYLGDKLGMVSSALTFTDVHPRLQARGVDDDLLEELRVVFHACEAGSYSGGAQSMAPEELRTRALSVVRQLEKAL